MEDYTEKLERQNRELESELAINVDARKNLTNGLKKALLLLKGTIYELEEKKLAHASGWSGFPEISEKTEQHFLKMKVDFFLTQKIPPSTPEIDGIIERIQNG